MLKQLALALAAVCAAPAYAEHDGTNPFAINVGLSGSWYTPEFTGQGFLLDVITSNEQLFVTWFNYRKADDATPGNGLVADEQRWYVAQGSYAGHSAELPLFRTTGGRFNTGMPVDLQQIGTLTIHFNDCNNATVEVLFDGDAQSSNLAITRLTPDINCVRLNPVAQIGH